MASGIWNIPVPAEGIEVLPDIVVSPVVGFDPACYRLGYGGGFYDRMLATLEPRPFTVGLGFSNGFLPDFEPESHDLPLDAILNDNGVVWPV